MKNFLFKFTALLCLLCMGVSNAWGETYTVTFTSQTSGTSDGSTKLTKTTDIIVSGSDYLTVESTANIYSGKTGYGIKGGSSSSKGSITLKSTDAGRVKPSKITVSACYYGSDGKDLNIYLNGAETASSTLDLASSFQDFDITMDGKTELQSIKLEASKTSDARFYVKTITVTYDNDGSGSGDDSGNSTGSSVDAPKFSLPAGTYATPQTVTITGPSGSSLYYTMGDDDISQGEAGKCAYEAASVLISQTTTLRAVAWLNGQFSEEASALYTIGEVPITPGTYDIAPTNSFWGTSYSGTATGATSASGSQDGISIQWDKNAGNAMYINDDQSRIYAQHSLTFSVPDGYAITKIVFTADGTNWSGTHVASAGTMTDDKHWTGQEQSTTITFGGTCRITKITVTYDKVSTPKNLSSLVISGKPTKKNYEIGESFDPTGLTVTATYSDESTKDVTDIVEWEFDDLTLETTTLKVIAYIGDVLSEVYEVSELTVTQSPYVTISSFSDISGDIDGNTSYVAYQGNASTAPGIYNDCIRLYQAKSEGDYGGYVTISGGKGVKIQATKIRLDSTYASTTVGIAIDDAEAPMTGDEVKANATYIKSGLNCGSISFYCLGADKDTRLEIAEIAVIYTKEDIALSSISANTDDAITEFGLNETFRHDRVKVFAHYSDGSEQEVTNSASFSTPDMTTTGTKTVTISYTENGETEETSYDITVTETIQSDYLFYESFDTNSGTGGNDDKWSGSIASNVIKSDNEGWIFANEKGANQCAKFGTGSAKGSAKTPSIGFSGNAMLTFKAGAWDNADERLSIKVSLTNGKITSSSAADGTESSIIVNISKAAWTDIMLFISDVNESTQITFEAVNESSNRFFLDEVKVVEYTPSPLDRIALSGTLGKTEYEVGESFDKTGLSVIATFENESTSDITKFCEWTITPESLTAEITEVSVSVSYAGKTDTKNYQVSVKKKESSIAIENHALGLDASWEIEAATTPEDAAITYEIIEGEGIVEILNGTMIHSLAVGTATIRATISETGTYQTSHCDFEVSVTDFKSVSTGSFSAISGTLDSNISYTAYQGNAATAPAINNGCIRLYQNGGYITIKGGQGVTIHEVSLTSGATYASTTVGIAINDAEAPTSGETLAKNSTITKSNLNCSSISFYCLGKDKNTRLDIASISVSYTKEEGIELSGIGLSGDYPTEFIQNQAFSHEGMTVTATYTNGNTQKVTDRATFSTPDMTVTGEQEITVSYTEDDISKEANYTITITPEVITELALSGNYQTRFKMGDSFNHDNLVVKASFNSGRTGIDVTDKAEISAPDMYKAGRKEVFVSYGGLQTAYIILVTDPSLIFYESFDTNSGTGGNDNQWGGTIANNDIQSDNEGWIFANGNGANQCAKFGTGKNMGSATTPALGYTGNAILSFKAAAWNSSSEATTINLSIEGTGTISSESITLVKGQWSTYYITLTGLTEDSKIKFEANTASSNRFFLDEVKVFTQIGENITLKSNERLEGWKTFYSEDWNCAVDDATTIYIAQKESDGTSIKVKAMEGKIIPASTPVLLHTTNSDSYQIQLTPTPESATDDYTGNALLVAAQSGAIEGAYILAYTKSGGLAFYSFTGTLDLGDIYMIPTIPTGASALRIIIDDESANGLPMMNAKVEDKLIYNLSGQRIKPTKGLVVKGNKVIMIK